MNYYEWINAEKYLYRFDQILNEMTNKMLIKPTTDDITIYFIRCMVPHHQAAIDMCENLLRYTTYSPLIQVATNIIKVQQKGIKDMLEIARTTSGNKNSRYELENYTRIYKEIAKNMILGMKNSPRTMKINLDFTGEMIPHHKGAIAMCNNLLQYRIDPRLRIVAQNIIKEQTRGVEQLEAIRKNLQHR